MRILLMFILVSSFCYAQDKNEFLTGNFGFDEQIVLQETMANLQFDDQEIQMNKKSPLLAGLFSVVLPGAGEFYAESYWKSALFMAIEATAISVGLIYDGKGDDQTQVFEGYANQHWDVAKYARWTFDNLDHLESKIGNSVDRDKYSGLFLDEARTQVDWELLNALESDIGGWYSHRLEYFGEQQYYEMIGKYPQFNPGWEDFNENSIYTYTVTERDPVTEMFDHYSGMRGKANDYYNIASGAVIAVVINHIISAADAAWTTSRYNKKLNMHVSIEKQQIGYFTEYYPQLNMSFNF